MGGRAHEVARLGDVVDDLRIQRREELEQVAQPFHQVPGPRRQHVFAGGELPHRVLLGRGQLRVGDAGDSLVFPRQRLQQFQGRLARVIEGTHCRELLGGRNELLRERVEVAVLQHFPQSRQQPADGGVAFALGRRPGAVAFQVGRGQEMGKHRQVRLCARRKPAEGLLPLRLDLGGGFLVSALGSQQDFLLFLEDLLQLVAGPAHGPLHAGHHGALGLLLLVPEHGRHLRHLVEELPRQLHRALDVAFPELLADLVHHGAHVGERHVAQVLRVDELVRNLLGELHQRGL